MRITFAPLSGSREHPRAPAAPTTTSLEPRREPLAEPLPAPPHPADREALALKAARERVIIPLARAARAFIRARGWTRYGYARLSDFGMEVLDHSSRSLTDLASLGWSLERLPRLRSALTGEDGGRPLGQVAATLIGRVAGRDSLPAWIALARSVPVRELRAQVALARRQRSPLPLNGKAVANHATPPGPPPSTFSSGVPGTPPASAQSTFSSGVPANPPASAPSTFSSGVPTNPPTFAPSTFSSGLLGDLPPTTPSQSPQRKLGSRTALASIVALDSGLRRNDGAGSDRPAHLRHPVTPPSTFSSGVLGDLPVAAPPPSPRRTPGSTDSVAIHLAAVPRPPTNEAAPAASLHPPSPDPPVEEAASSAGEPSPDPTVEEAADLALADDLVERATYRLPVPAPLRAAFDEGLELYRTVEGSHAPIAGFVEALLAEAVADGCDPDDAVVPVHPGFTRESRESRLRQWAPTLTDPAPSQAGFSPRAREVLARLEALEQEAGTGKATEVLQQMKELLALEDDLNAALGEALLQLAESRELPALGFLDVGHYAEERLGMSRSAAERRARLARAGRRFPQLARYHQAGWIKSQGALLVAQVLGPRPVDAAREREWVEAAMGRTLKRLRDDVRWAGAWRGRISTPPSTFSSAAPGDLPTSPPPSTFSSAVPGDLPTSPPPSTFSSAVPGDLSASPTPSPQPPTPSPQRKLGSRTAPDATVALDSGLRRNDGGTPRRSLDSGLRRNDGGTPRRSLDSGLHRPDGGTPPRSLDSGLRRNDGAGSDRPAHLRHPVPPPPTDAEWHASLRREPGLARERVRALALQALHGSPAADTLRLTLPLDLALDLAAVIAARRASCGKEAPAWHGLLALLLDFVETWDDPRATPRRPGDRIYERDGYRCAAPGCTSRRHLEVHHIVYRSHGGADDVTNELTLCRFHHARGEHGGLAQVTGKAPLGLLWRLGGAAHGAWFRNERRERAGKAASN